MLPIDEEDYDFRFLKNLNMDVKLKSNQYGEWDIVFDDLSNDWVNVTGTDSLINACIIAIMTRFNELDDIGMTSDYPPYEDFGCRVHELIKANKSKNVKYRIELFIEDTLNSIRRVKKVHWIMVEDIEDEYYNYSVSFCVSYLRDDDIEENMLDVVEDMFYI